MKKYQDVKKRLLQDPETKKEYDKLLNFSRLAEENIDELIDIISDYIFAIDKAVKQYPDLKKMFEDTTDWYEDLAKHT